MHPVFFTRRPPPPSDGYGWSWIIAVWGPVLLAVTVIVTESTDTFSAQHTSSWLRPIVERLIGAFSDPGWDAFHHYLRKTGHFAGYGTIGFTFLRAWLYTLACRGRLLLLSWRMEASILAILATAIVASADEFHQTFIPSRTGTPVDVLLDSAGATTLCLLVWLVCWTRRSSQVPAA